MSHRKCRDVFISDIALNGRVLANPNCRLIPEQQGIINLLTAPVYDYFADNFEPIVAVNPKDPNNIIAADFVVNLRRETPVFYSLDGGKTWQWVNVPANQCMQTIPEGAINDFGSSGDPWVSFGKDGDAYFSIGTSNRLFRPNGTVLRILGGAVLIFKSTDKGQSWNAPVSLAFNPIQFPDKPAIFASPLITDLIHVVYHEIGLISTTYQRSVDGGNLWLSPIVLTYDDVDYPKVFIWGANVATLPDKTVIVSVRNSIFDTALDIGFGPGQNEAIYINRSFDNGASFGPTIVAIQSLTQTIAWDPVTEYIIHDTSIWHDIDVNKCNGYLYIIAQDSTFYTGPSLNDGFEFLGAGTIIIMSKDGGVTWSKKIPINPTSTDKQAYMATVTVLDNGIVCVPYYTDRNQNYEGDDGTGPLNTDVFISLFDKNLNFIGEKRVTENSFDMRKFNAEIFIGYPAFAVGDYLKCDSICNDVLIPLIIGNQDQVGTFPRPPTVPVHTIIRDSQYLKFARVHIGKDDFSTCIRHNQLVQLPKKKNVVERKILSEKNSDELIEMRGNRLSLKYRIIQNNGK